MRILVTGANGQLGAELRQLSRQYDAFTYQFTDVDELDITSEIAVKRLAEDFRPDVIINASAYTAVDKAEEEQAKAEAINASGPANLANAARQYGALLVHVSTDYVFNGKHYKPYQETDNPSPLGVYGQTKLQGEQEIIKQGGSALIIRTSWLYSATGHNFVKTMLRLGKERDNLHVVNDQIGSPTFAGDLAESILKIISLTATDKPQIYHYTNEGVASWYDFAWEIFRIKGINCKVHPIATKDYPTPAPRPYYSVLEKSRVRQDFNLPIPHWKDSLKRCLTVL